MSNTCSSQDLSTDAEVHAIFVKGKNGTILSNDK